VNERGLVVSLAFGGRREVGDGFGIPLIPSPAAAAANHRS
jgi:predicted choloylglycine hydrolase